MAKDAFEKTLVVMAVLIGILSLIFAATGDWSVAAWGGATFGLGLISYAVGYLLNGFVKEYNRMRRESQAEQDRRLKKILEDREAVSRRADIQNEYLITGGVNNDPKKLRHGTYGEYPPVMLEWPEGMTA